MACQKKQRLETALKIPGKTEKNDFHLFLDVLQKGIPGHWLRAN